ncbi:HEAT repeat domain-containing protein [Sinomicrobium weinanense]|uniref:HEAT repeat domain-containing protein n=1 Tax=Sinomicrobium weinanense TaxID=2842200 RepID=A0A926Q2N9_9FLAO|nr:HEAT repeat domain-containing protein [Sinomicrobium weinanense]MBC9796044.1 HEAT repeat domain-containing protein [Sinomicrobium weinanense]MBU3123137.1 HEAT repeat domain-containing protein [Sinomicrobium weinanense]
MDKIFNDYFQWPVFIKLAAAVSVIAVIGGGLVYLFILLWRRKGYINDRKKARLLPEMRELIVKHVILAKGDVPLEAVTFPLDDFRKLGIRKADVRRFFVEELMEYRRNFSGRPRQLLTRLYTDLGLHHITEKNLTCKRTQGIISALNELISMGVPVNEDKVLPLLDHENRYVREGARCYFVKLSEDRPFFFLEKISTPLLYWEQIEMFRIITQRKDVEIPDFSRWISSEYHPSVISFCLKLAVYYQQFETGPAMMKLLDTENEKLRARLINALGKLMVEKAESRLVAMYCDQPWSCKQEILKALGRIGSGNSLVFLRDKFETEQEIPLVKHAAKSIVNHRALSENLLREMQAGAVGLKHTVLQHAANPLIKY